MNRKAITGRQLSCWLLAAISAPILQIAGKAHWSAAILVAVCCGLLCWAVWCRPGQWLQNRSWYAFVQILWLSVILGEFLQWSDLAWPTGRDYPVVPLILLLLAALSALNGVRSAASVNSIVLWFVVFLAASVFVAGLDNVQVPDLQTPPQILSSETLLVLLIPAVAIFLPKQEEKGNPKVLPVICLLFVGVTLWTVGILSEQICSSDPWPFYEASKSLSLLNVAKRFESLVSVAATLGYFSLYSYLLSCAGALAARIDYKYEKTGIAASALAAGAIVLLKPELPMNGIVIITLILWIILPVFGGLYEKKKR